MKSERAVPGPSLDETWRRVDATAKAVMETFARGEVPVSGVKRALPLLDALGVAEADRELHLEHAPDGACQYCAFGAICGRRWEALAQNGAGITIVSASAGSGKTHRLTQEVVTSLAAGARERVDVTGLVAVTFTRKAHDELAGRIRHALVASGAYDEGDAVAARVRGHRPRRGAAAASGVRARRRALSERRRRRGRREEAPSPSTRARAGRYGSRATGRACGAPGAPDRARGGRLGDAGRRDHGPRALESDPTGGPRCDGRALHCVVARKLLPRAVGDGRVLEAALGAELERVQAALSADTTKITMEAVDIVRKARQALLDGELPLVDLAEARHPPKTSKASAPLVHDLQGAAAARYEEHPRFHEELRATTFAIFDAAPSRPRCAPAVEARGVASSTMSTCSTERSISSSTHASAPSSGRASSSSWSTSSKTRAPFSSRCSARLHALAGRSLWVGDRKQCIFEYAGADPVLMDAVAGWVERDGGSAGAL